MMENDGFEDDRKALKEAPKESTPLERLKRWYVRNEDAVIVTALIGSAASLVLYRVIDGKNVRYGSIATRDDGASLILVKLKNGRTRTLIKRVEDN